MKVRIEIFAELIKDKPNSLVYLANKEFKTEQAITGFTINALRKLDILYEEKITIRAKIYIEPIEIDISNLKK